jgi:hypothetical protein
MDISEIIQNCILYLIGLTLLVGILNIRKYWKTPSSLILLYLLDLFLIELIGRVWIVDDNQWLYNISGVIEFIIISIMYYISITKPKSKFFVIFIFVVCILFLAADANFFKATYMEFWTNAFGLIYLGISSMAVLYLLEMATTEKVVHQNRILLYWVSIGLLVYHFVNLTNTVLVNQLEEIGNENNVLMILWAAGITMYFCFIIGFVCTKIKNNS